MRRRASAARAGRLPAVPGSGQIRQVRLVAAGAGLGTWHGITTAPAVAGAHIRSGLGMQPASTAIEAPTRTIVASRDEPPARDDAREPPIGAAGGISAYIC